MNEKKTYLAIVMLALVAASVLVIASRPLRIRYHRWRMVSEWNQVIEIGARGNQGPHIMAFEKHKDALVYLGYFRHTKIPLISIAVPSDESRALFKALNHPVEITTAYFQIWGYEPETPDAVEIWATPERLQLLENIIRKHDKQDTAE